MTNYQFWRPSLFALLIGAVVLALCAVLQISTAMDPLRQSGVLSKLILPEASITPEQVIRIQIDALRNESQGLGALQCYCFAAPENRIVTGPIERFTVMVRQPPFDILQQVATYTIEPPEFQDDMARCLVFVVGENRNLRAFSWILKKHREEPFDECWLTAGVFLLYDSEQPLEIQQFEARHKKSRNFASGLESRPYPS